MQHARMPCDLACVVAQEIVRVELGPELSLNALGQRVEPQLLQCELLTALETAAGWIRVARQITARGPEQVLEQLRLPRIPDFRARAADIGYGQQIKCGQ